MIPILSVVWLAVAVPETVEDVHQASGTEIELSLGNMPSLLEAAVLTVTVRTEENMPDAGIQVVLPSGITKTGGSLCWITSLEAGDSVSFSCDIYILQKGVWSIEAYLRSKTNQILDSTSLGLKISSSGSALLGQETEKEMTLDALFPELEAATTGTFVGGATCALLGSMVGAGVGAMVEGGEGIAWHSVSTGAYVGGAIGSALGAAYQLNRKAACTGQDNLFSWALTGAAVAAAAPTVIAIYTGHLVPYFLVTVPIGAVVGYEIGTRQSSDETNLWQH